MVCAVMGAYLRLRRQLRLPSFRRTMALWGVGALQCTHWVLFYASIRLSNVSVALVCISLMGFFSAVLSPIILGAKWSAKEFVFSGITIAGIALIFHFDTHYRLGITVGVVSSLVASLFVVCNKKVTGTLPAVEMFFHEMVGGLLYLTLLMPAYLRVFPPASLTPTGSDAVYLLLLAILCTVVLYILQLQALELVSAFTVNLSLNLEPVYAIILAALFLGEAEEFTVSFYLGLSLIILSVALQTVSIMRERKAENALAPS